MSDRRPIGDQRVRIIAADEEIPVAANQPLRVFGKVAGVEASAELALSRQGNFRHLRIPRFPGWKLPLDKSAKRKFSQLKQSGPRLALPKLANAGNFCGIKLPIQQYSLIIPSFRQPHHFDFSKIRPPALAECACWGLGVAHVAPSKAPSLKG